MGQKEFDDVKVNVTLQQTSTHANLSTSSEDLAVQMGKLREWYPNLFHYGTCSTAPATVPKAVNCQGFQLKTGSLIAVKFSSTNAVAVGDITMDVNGTGIYHVKYRNTSNLPDKNYLAANVTYFFIFDGTYWQWMGDTTYNTNNYDRTSMQTRIKAGGVGAFQYSIVALNDSQYMESMTTTSGTGTSKAFNTDAKFMYPPVIFYKYDSANTASGNVIANNVLYEQFPSCDMRYSCNITSTAGSTSFTQYLPVFIECTFDADGYWSPTGMKQKFTQGKYYILLGCMYSTSVYQIALFAQHPLYYYDGTKLVDGERHSGITGSGTTGSIAKFTGTHEIGNASWTTNTPTTCAISQGVLTFTAGTSASLT